MNIFFKFIWIISMALVIGVIITGCASMQLVSIDNNSIAGPAQVRQFGTIDPKDVTIFGFYKDDSRKQVSINSRDITFDSSRVGPQTVDIKTSVGTVSFQTEVMELKGITIASPPSKPLFKIGESADAGWPGLEIRGEWDRMGSDVIPTASLQFTGYSSEPAGRKTITVTYGGQTASFNVEVLALTSIELEKPPTKTDYSVGTALDLAGISLYGNYGATASNRIRELIPQNQLTASGFDANRTGQQRVTVTVMGQSATFTVNVTQVFYQMVFVPGGTFEMGKKLGTSNTGSDVNPIHTVTLSGFYIGKYVVTQSQWKTIMGETIEERQASAASPTEATTNYGRGDDYPAYYINFYAALVFCNKLSIREGLTPAYRINNSTNPDDWGEVPTANASPNKAVWDAVTIVSGSTGYRLPTESQWEYAAKGGNPTAAGWVGYTWAGSNRINDVAWVYSNNGGRGTATYGTKAVGTKAPNRLGLYDMTGNVRELCWDFNEAYTDEAKTDPTGASTGTNRVTRGGGWGDNDAMSTSTFRSWSAPWARGYTNGFRLVRPAQ